MRILKISLLVFILSITISAQWYWQNPTPFGNGLSEIQMLTSSLGYACGSGGTLIKTSDGGENWFELETGTNDLIIDIFFISGETGWMLTYSDRIIYKTTDGGLNWEILSNLAPRYAHSLWFVDEMKGFASGYQNLLITTDGGINWNELTNINWPSAMYFLNQDIGFVGGYNTIYKTTDGGNSWSNISIPTIEYYLEDIFALDQGKIFVVGGGYFQGEPYYNFMKTINGGFSWSGVSFENPVTSVYFRNIMEGYLTSDKIYKTTDLGSIWTPTDYLASELEFVDENSWAISGWNTIIYSNDFWSSAHQQIKSVFSGFLWSGAAKDTNVVFACGSDRTIVGSLDGGHSWNKYYESVGQSYLNAITFHNDEIWSVGAGGIILKSTNNGSSWEEFYINASWLSDIKFINNDIGFIVGSISGLACLYTTQDGGGSWELQQTFPEYFSIDGIEFSQANLGWMFVNQNGLLKSTDLGRTWNVLLDSIYYFADIAVWENSAWFTYYNRVLRTTDAGTTWESFKVFDYDQTSYWGFELDFVNNNIGYAGVYDGRIFTTSDGGETWNEEEFQSAMPIQSLDFVDSRRGWTFGDFGTILKRDPNYVFVDDEIKSYPNYISLFQNYPNPFNPTTKIKYSIPPITLRQAQSDIKVTLKVYDILGREVATLVNQEKPAGEYEVEFDASELTNGVYFYRLQSGLFIETKKMILLK